LGKRGEPVVVVTLVGADLGHGERGHAHRDHTPVIQVRAAYRIRFFDLRLTG
jgi:hypothetical protein